MMITRFVLTLLVGLLVVAPSGDALAVWWLFEDKKTVPGFKNSPWTGRPDAQVCNMSSQGGGWLREAKRRGLNCGVGETTQTANTANSTPALALINVNNSALCRLAANNKGWETKRQFQVHVKEAKRRGLSCGVTEVVSTTQSVEGRDTWVSKLSDANICHYSGVQSGLPYDEKRVAPLIAEAKSRGLTCGVGETTDTQRTSAPNTKPRTGTFLKSHTLLAKGREGRDECIARAEEEVMKELADTHFKGFMENKIKVLGTSRVFDESGGNLFCQLTLEYQIAEQGNVSSRPGSLNLGVSNDTQVPLITITQSGADGRKGSVKGYAKDNVQVAEVLIDGQAVRLGNDGSFEWSGFVPVTGKEITIEAIDTAALSSTQVISLKRGQIKQASGPRFDVLDPTAGKKVKRNDNALALIVGISDYKRTDAPAVYADKDAQYFHDYASLKLGISDSNIKTLVNAKAEQGDVILAVKDWMRRSSKPGKTEVYVFFAGHGLASDDGEQMYLLPYDGRPRLLDDTAILRDRLFADISAANPRSVTVFLDTYYSGTTRGTDMLIASRPIAIKALKQSVPDNFTVMTAARGDQTAKPLEEAKHGMFSYFLMKGMEGEADANQDNKITAGELHEYVERNVVQQSSGSQTPELQGDANRVLVRFQ